MEYTNVRNHIENQGFYFSGIGLGILVGPGAIIPFARLIGQNIQGGYRVSGDKTDEITRQTTETVLTEDTIQNASEDRKTEDTLKKLGVTRAADSRSIGTKNAKIADVTIIGDQSTIIEKDGIYTPANSDERIVMTLQVARNMNGQETYHLLLMTVPKVVQTQGLTYKGKTSEISKLSESELIVLQKLVKIGSLPDTLKGDIKNLRQKYPEMEASNNLQKNGDYIMNLSELQEVVKKMNRDKKLMTYIHKS